MKYTDLNLHINEETKTIEFNNDFVIIKQYLPVEQKLELIGKAMNYAHDSNNFSNTIKGNVCLDIMIIDYYTDIEFDEEMEIDVVYDELSSKGLLDQIKNEIPCKELDFISYGFCSIVDNYYKYRNSVLGILDIMKTDYSDLEFSIENLQEKLANGENIDLLKKILTDLG
jgi:hypothetical protein